MRPVDRLFDRYGGYHRHPGNKALHWVCVPLIVWSVVGLLWSAAPVAAYLAIAAALAFYLWLSWPIALGMAAILALMLGLVKALGGHALLLAAAVFCVAWVGQFVGHAIEGSRPSFLEDVRSFLVGPAWLLGALYRRLGIAF